MLSSVKHAFRVLRKDPGFTAVAICSMAIGIGATSAMFKLRRCDSAAAAANTRTRPRGRD
jgi:hypothetical protein